MPTLDDSFSVVLNKVLNNVADNLDHNANVTFL